MLSEYFMLFSVLGVILAFLVLGLVLWTIELRKRRRFTEKAILFHNLSRENAETLYTLTNDKKIASTKEVYTRVRPNENRVESLQRENFYCLIRWIKRLREAENEQQLKVTVVQVVREMERRARSYGIDLLDQKRLYDLANLPEDVLVHYELDQK